MRKFVAIVGEVAVLQGIRELILMEDFSIVD